MKARRLDPRVRTLIVVVLGASAASLAVALGPDGRSAEADRADDPMHGYFRGRMPRYPGASEFPLGSQLRSGPEPMRMSYFFTDVTPSRVADYYKNIWAMQGMFVRDDVTPQGGYVGTYDVGSGVTLTVSMVRRGESTLVMPTEIGSPFRALDAGDLGDRAGLPVFPGSDSGMTFGATDRGPARRSLVVSYGNWGGMRDNVEFFQNEMRLRGWTETPSRAGDEGHRTLSFRRGDDQCDVGLTPLGAPGQGAGAERGRVRVFITLVNP